MPEPEPGLGVPLCWSGSAFRPPDLRPLRGMVLAVFDGAAALPEGVVAMLWSIDLVLGNVGPVLPLDGAEAMPPPVWALATAAPPTAAVTATIRSRLIARAILSWSRCHY